MFDSFSFIEEKIIQKMQKTYEEEKKLLEQINLSEIRNKVLWVMKCHMNIVRKKISI